jgi:hypothetical protein
MKLTMITPYSIPSTPSVPRGTPSSIKKALKPPIHNPFDKFTQPEFDAWIKDITGSLRRALGHSTEVPGKETLYETEYDTGEREGVEDLEENESVDDSVAELRARHLKGKARDPREGPGLGGKNQPIEIESDSEAEQGGSKRNSLYQWREKRDESDDDGSDNDEPLDTSAGLGSNPHEPIELISDEEDEVEAQGAIDEDGRDTVMTSDDIFATNGREHPESWTRSSLAESHDGEEEYKSDVEQVPDPDGQSPSVLARL